MCFNRTLFSVRLFFFYKFMLRTQFAQPTSGWGCYINGMNRYVYILHTSPVSVPSLEKFKTVTCDLNNNVENELLHKREYLRSKRTGGEYTRKYTLVSEDKKNPGLCPSTDDMARTYYLHKLTIQYCFRHHDDLYCNTFFFSFPSTVNECTINV